VAGRRGAAMKRCVLVIALGVGLTPMMISGEALGAADCGEPVMAPKLQVGDMWVLPSEKEGAESTAEVVGFEGDLAVIQFKNPAFEGGKEFWTYVDSERVIRKVKRPNGEVVTRQGAGWPYDRLGQRELDFPLSVGKEWSFSFPTRGQDVGWRLYKIVACEEVSVAAGRFSALKIAVEVRVRNWTGKYWWWYAAKAKSSVKFEFPPEFGAPVRDMELLLFKVK
jgi:hypothetical protein